MSLLYHPDKLGDKSEEEKAQGNALFIKVYCTCVCVCIQIHTYMGDVSEEENDHGGALFVRPCIHASMHPHMSRSKLEATCGLLRCSVCV